jgi:hypothetical protein
MKSYNKKLLSMVVCIFLLTSMMVKEVTQQYGMTVCRYTSAQFAALKALCRNHSDAAFCDHIFGEG